MFSMLDPNFLDVVARRSARSVEWWRHPRRLGHRGRIAMPS